MHWKQTLMLGDLAKSLNCSMDPSPWAVVETSPGEEAPYLLWNCTFALGPWDFWKERNHNTKTKHPSERMPNIAEELGIHRTERSR